MFTKYWLSCQYMMAQIWVKAHMKQFWRFPWTQSSVSLILLGWSWSLHIVSYQVILRVQYMKVHLVQRPLDSGRSHSCLSGRRMTKDRITWRQVKVDWMIAGMLSSYLVDRPLAKVAVPVPGLEMLHHLDQAHRPTSCREVKALL